MRKASIAWVEEWMSWRAENILPYLADRFDITYVTCGEEVPDARFTAVRQLPRSKHMMLGGFGLSRCVDELYRAGEIDLAVVYASIGFAIRHAPYISIEGGSVYYETRLFSSLAPWYRKPRFAVGFLHYALPEMFCVRRAKRVVAISHALKQDIMALHQIPDDHIDVVYNGIGQEYLDTYKQRKPGNKVRVLYIGRLHYRKGIVEVLSEFTRRPEIDVEFVVGGEGPDRDAVEALVRRDPRIVYLGSIKHSRVVEELKAADIYIFPTHYEGFGSSLAEGMAAGLACLTYDIPVTREILGDCGRLVPRGDAGALMNCLAEILKDPEARLRYGAAAHERVRRFSWDTCARGLESVISRELGLCGRAGRAG